MKNFTYLTLSMLLYMPLKGSCAPLNKDAPVPYYNIQSVGTNVVPKINYISSTRQLHIETVNPFDIEEIRLYSILGQKVKQWTNLKPDSSGTLSVSLSNISKGTYLVSVKTKSGKFNKRLIIGK